MLSLRIRSSENDSVELLSRQLTARRDDSHSHSWVRLTSMQAMEAHGLPATRVQLTLSGPPMCAGVVLTAAVESVHEWAGALLELNLGHSLSPKGRYRQL